MKSFYIALCVLILLVATIVLNCIYINKVSNDLVSVIEEIKNASPNDLASKIDDLEGIWSNEKIKISTSIGYVTINKIDDTISSIKAACEEQSLYDFKNYLSILENAVRELTRLENFSVFNIL